MEPYVKIATMVVGTGISAGMAIHEVISKKKAQKKIENLEAQLTEIHKVVKDLKLQNEKQSQRRESETDVLSDSGHNEEQEAHDSFLRDIDNLLDIFDITKAREMLIKKTSEVKNVEYFWRLALVYLVEAGPYNPWSNIEGRRRHIQIGIGHAEYAVELEPTNAFAQKFLALLLMANLCMDPMEKLKNMPRCSKQLSLALQWLPDDDELSLMSCQLKYEVATLTWIDWIRARLVADFPHATLEEATSATQKYCDSRTHPHPIGLLILGKCYLASGNHAKGFWYLNLVKTIFQGPNPFNLKHVPVRVKSNMRDAVEFEIGMICSKYKQFIP